VTTKRKTGERQQARQPFSIDKLPQAVQETIMLLYGTKGLSFQRIEDLSAEPVGSGKLGFVDWDKLEPEILALFPNKRIPKSNIQRYIDVRFRQAQEDIRVRSAQAREVAEAFASSVVENDHEAVANAIRDQLMALTAEDRTASGRLRISKVLLGLMELQQEARLNDIKERQVAANERKLAAAERREKLAIAKLEAETERLTKKASSGQPITQQDLDDIRKKAFGF
jgi:hypothetical protein